MTRHMSAIREGRLQARFALLEAELSAAANNRRARAQVHICS